MSKKGPTPKKVKLEKGETYGKKRKIEIEQTKPTRVTHHSLRRATQGQIEEKPSPTDTPSLAPDVPSSLVPIIPSSQALDSTPRYTIEGNQEPILSPTPKQEAPTSKPIEQTNENPLEKEKIEFITIDGDEISLDDLITHQLP